MKDRSTDMTVGNPVKHILLFSIPALIGNIFQQIYNLTDTIIVGRFVGAEALAAVGATFSITFLFFALCNGISSGGGIIVSQYYGAHDNDNVKRTIVNTGFIMLIVPIFFGSIGFVLAPYLLQLLSTPESIIAASTMYVRFMCVGLLFTSLYNFFTAVLRALGDSKTPLYFLIISTIINVIFDVTFVYFFNLGIKGVALATVIAQFISALSCGLIAISSMAVQRIVNSYGTVVVAAFAATNRIEQFVHMPYTTLGMSLSTYCGQNFGAKKYDRVYTGYKKGLVMMAILSCVLLLVMQFFGGAITSLFVSEKEVIELGMMGLKLTSLFYFTLGMIYVVRGVLTGTGDAFFALFNGVVEVIGRFTIPIILTSYLGMGPKGIWLSAGIVWAVSGVTAWLRYYFHFHRRYVGSNISFIEPSEQPALFHKKAAAHN